eukprot:scaffold112077_cov32-Tisochrysis_lutea.AAC.4
MDMAATAAHAPGTGTSGMPASAQEAAKIAPGSEMPGVPASLTTAMVAPFEANSIIRALAARALCSWCDICFFVDAPRWRSSFAVCRVSSEATKSASFRVRTARSVMSSRFPMGVLTK